MLSFRFRCFVKPSHLAFVASLILMIGQAFFTPAAHAAPKPVTTNRPIAGQVPKDAVINSAQTIPPAAVQVPRPDDDELTMAHGGDEPLTKREYRMFFGKDPDPAMDVPREGGGAVKQMTPIATTVGNKSVRQLKTLTAEDLGKVAARFEALQPPPEIRFSIIRSTEKNIPPATIPAGLGQASLYTDKAGEVTGELVLENFSDADYRPGTYLIQISSRAPAGRLVNPAYDWAMPAGLAHMEARQLNPAFVPLLSAGSPLDQPVGGQLLQEAFARNTVRKRYVATFPISSKILLTAIATAAKNTGGMVYVRLVPVKPRGGAGGVLDRRITQKSIKDGLDAQPAANNPRITKREADALARQAGRSGFDPSAWEPVAAPTAWQPVFFAGSSVQVAVNAYKDEFSTFQKAVNSGYQVRIAGYVPPKLNDDIDLQTYAPIDYYELKRDVTFKGRHWKKGQQFSLYWARHELNRKESSVWSDLWDLVTGTISMVSGAYESVKNAAVNVVAAALNATGVDFLQCGEQCRKNLMTGLNVALSACGLPPSIPDVGQIYANGADYMAGMLAQAVLEQATGVDLGLVGNVVKDAAAQEARERAHQAARAGIDALANELMQLNPGKAYNGSDPTTWGVPSSLVRAHPAVLYVEITRAGTLNALAESIEEMHIAITYAYKHSKNLKVGDPMFEHQATFPVYFAPGVTRMIVPVVLNKPRQPFLGLYASPNYYDNPAYNAGDKLTWFGQPFYNVSSSGVLNGKISISTRHRAPGKTVKELLLTRQWGTAKPHYDFGQPFGDGAVIYGYRKFEFAPSQ